MDEMHIMTSLSLTFVDEVNGDMTVVVRKEGILSLFYFKMLAFS